MSGVETGERIRSVWYVCKQYVCHQATWDLTNHRAVHSDRERS